MKKIVRKSDGSEETFEGTPEELADFERRQREGLTEVPQRKGKKLLLEEVARAVKEYLEKNPPGQEHHHHYAPHWIWGHGVGCQCWSCRPIAPSPRWWEVGPWELGRYLGPTITFTSDNTQLDLPHPDGVRTNALGVLDVKA
jgi:hypothetical protein